LSGKLLAASSIAASNQARLVILDHVTAVERDDSKRVRRVSGQLALHPCPALLGRLGRKNPLPVAQDDDREASEVPRLPQASQARAEVEPCPSIVERRWRRRSGFAGRIDEHEPVDVRRISACVEESVEPTCRVTDENDGTVQRGSTNERMDVLDIALERSAVASPDIAPPDPCPVERAESDVAHLLSNARPGLRWDVQAVVCEHRRAAPGALDEETQLRLDSHSLSEVLGRACCVPVGGGATYESQRASYGEGSLRGRRDHVHPSLNKAHPASSPLRDY